jgi:hypothetical protein
MRLNGVVPHLVCLGGNQLAAIFSDISRVAILHFAGV